MKFFLIFVFFIQSLYCISQEIKPFEISAPIVEGSKAIGYFRRVVCDSQIIFLMGLVQKKIADVSKTTHPFFETFSYSGEAMSYKFIIDTTLNFNAFINEKMFQKNDSIYIGYFYVLSPYNSALARYGLFEINIRQLSIRQRFIFYDFKLQQDVGILTDTEVKNSVFHFVLREYDRPQGYAYLYEMDTDFNIRKNFRIHYDSSYLNYRWASASKDGNFDIIVEHVLFKGLNSLGRGYLVYLKVDSTGKLLKRKKLPLDENIYISTGESFTIVRNEDGTFVIGCIERGNDPDVVDARPYLIKTSPEFDSIHWKVSLSAFPSFVTNPRYSIHFLIQMNDNSGYLLCGDWRTPLFKETDYGLLFKVSNTGDSLWTRKYQPVGWDSLRTTGIKFNQIVNTPYNTIAVAADVTDTSTGYWHPWVLHLDKDGCLIPGCGEYVNVKDVVSGKQKAFEIYPNPVSDKLYMLSRINSKSPLRMSLINLQGKVVLQNKINVNVGVQYIIDIPESLPSSTYILQIMDDKGKVWMSEKIIKEL